MKLPRFSIFQTLIVLLSIIICSQCYFSKHYRKCKLFKSHNAKQLSQFIQERVPTYHSDFYIEPLIEKRKPLTYSPIDYLYHEYIGAGGSGQVYLVEDLATNQPKVLKRFFKEKKKQFQEENFIMEKLNYTIAWMKDDANGVPKRSDYEKDVNQHKQIPTMAIFPSKQSLTLRDVEFFPMQAKTIFYKIIVEIEKAHKNSIIHNDLKMGNIMVNSLGSDFKFFQIQLIDWNLATFYFLGLQGNTKKGTTCYYSPEQILRANHYTPAIDIWALGVVMWSFMTEHKPFFADCKQDNLKAIASLVGMDKIIQIRQKYRYPLVDEYYSLLKEHEENPQQYRKRQLKQLVPKDMKDFFSNELIDLFEKMLNPDSQERITANELLQHEFFKEIKRIPPMFSQKRSAEEKKHHKK